MFLPLVFFIFLQIMILISSSSSAESSTIELGKPGCPYKCGNITIPYPFGDYQNQCSMVEDDADKVYYVFCNTSYNPPKAFLGMNREFEILSISPEMEFRIKNTAVGAKCYDDRTGEVVLDKPFNKLNFGATPFTISYTKNTYVGIGCNVLGFIHNQTVPRPCSSKCGSKADVIEGSCTGSGCCEAIIPKSLNYFMGEVMVNSTAEYHSQCSFAFLVETGKYTFQGSDLQQDGRLTKPDMDLPLVLDWAIGARSCKEAQTITPNYPSDRYACKNNTDCSNAPDNPGYRCACKKGYQGNPYLGCQDINECEDENNNPCYGTCTNTLGGYNCSACPEGSTGDGIKNGTSCTALPTKDGFPVLRVAL
ncbi:hypothetical protein MKW92_027916, partial [Papaver armeniacum]